MIQTFFSRAGPWAAVFVSTAWLAGQIVRDRTWLTGLMFYVPTPVLTAWLLVMAAAALRLRSRRWTWYCACAVLPAAFLAAIENRWTEADQGNPRGQRLRLVHWNLGRTAMGWSRQRALLERLHPDIIVLSETSDEVLPEHFPGLRVLQMKKMLIAARGPMSASGSLISGGALHAFRIQCALPDGPLNLVIADMTSNINIHRDPYLRPLVQMLDKLQPAIVVGDLNAPRRSLAFCSLPEGYQHAYDAAGSGWSYTWPAPVPFLAIDQCICGPNVTVVDYQLRSTLLSDHCIQILDFAL